MDTGQQSIPSSNCDLQSEFQPKPEFSFISAAVHSSEISYK